MKADHEHARVDPGDVSGEYPGIDLEVLVRLLELRAKESCGTPRREPVAAA